MILPLTWCLAGIGLANALAFVAQWQDKRRARQGRRRIPERTLLLLGLPLAAPGMFAGMVYFRHKTRKAAFLALAWLVALANVALSAGMAWAVGRGWLVLS